MGNWRRRTPRRLTTLDRSSDVDFSLHLVWCPTPGVVTTLPFPFSGYSLPPSLWTKSSHSPLFCLDVVPGDLCRLPPHPTPVPPFPSSQCPPFLPTTPVDSTRPVPHVSTTPLMTGVGRCTDALLESLWTDHRLRRGKSRV